MNKRVFIVCVLISFLACVQAESFARTPKVSLETTVFKGKVNLSEISGMGLHVVSVWDARRDSLVDADGFFDTVILSGRAQKIFLKDEHGNTRALAIVQPVPAELLIFDARSTAQALLFNNSASFSGNMQIQPMFRLFDAHPAFKDTVLFLKKRLPKESLEDLRRDESFLSLLNRCEKEIFGNDQQDIQESLKHAQRELEKVLP